MSGEGFVEVPSVRESVGSVHRSIVFERRNKTFGTEYTSSEPGRKIMIAQGFTPIPGTTYTVRVVKDTNPNDPSKGKLYVELVPDDAQEILSAAPDTIEGWRELEDAIDTAEIGVRSGLEARRAMNHLQMEIGNENSSDFYEEVLREHYADVEAGVAISEQLMEKGTASAELIELRSKNVHESLVKYRGLKNELSLARKKESELKELSSKSSAALRMLAEVRQGIQVLETEYEELCNSNPEAFAAIHLLELRGYRRALESGELAETPYVVAKAKDVEDHVRLGQPIFIHGHLGSGKTELALHVSKRVHEEGALIISGNKEMPLSEFFGHQVLDVAGADPSEYSRIEALVEAEFEQWKHERPGVSQAEADRAHDRILETKLAALQGGTISKFVLGPIYDAMEQGRPVIIDEANAIPHALLISLNHILTRRPGDVVTVQQNGNREITVQEGFCVIFTGNLNRGGQSIYSDRSSMDPALLSRLYKVEYDYLPQEVEGDLENADVVKKSEFFHLMLAFVMSRRGDAILPTGSLQKLWNLAKVARVTQDIFSGKAINEAFYPPSTAGERPTPPKLVESVLSIRALTKILTQWQGSGFEHDLDYYIFTEFITQSTVPQDQVCLYNLFRNGFGFFQGGDGWPDVSSKVGTLSALNVTPPKGSVQSLKFHTAREIVQAAFGPLPERDESEYVALASKK